MAELVNISQKAAIDRALREIRSGNVIALPLDNGYIFACDAFNRMAVRALHLLRNDPVGQAASLLIGDPARIVGIVREITPAAQALMDKFWPGMLTLYMRPHSALTWDLGDERLLDQIAVRAPHEEFVVQLLNESGPLAVAGAALSGRKPFTDPTLINDVFGSSIELIFENGAISGSKPSATESTVVDCTSTPPQIIRQGAVEYSSLLEAWPDISQDVD